MFNVLYFTIAIKNCKFRQLQELIAYLEKIMNLNMTSKTSNNPRLIKLRLAEELTRCCSKHFKTIPSNEYFAREFFFSSKYKLKVSRETVRKWFKGQSFPDLDYLAHLIDWLKLDISKVFPDADQVDMDRIPINRQYFNIDGLDQITTQQIDTFVLLIAAIKKSNMLVVDKSVK